MKQRFLLSVVRAGLAAIVLAGCASAPSTTAQATSPEPAPAPEAKPEPKPEPKVEPQTQPAKQAGKKPFNKMRLYQLDELETVTLKIGANTFKAWVMDTDSKRQEGMMHLTDAEVDPKEAMIFVFKEAQPLSFWMRNTRIPLDIAYLDANRTILNTATMKPFDEGLTPSAGPSKYAIEFKKGTFAKLGIKKGMKAEFPATVKSMD